MNDVWDFAKYAKTFSNQKRLIKEKFYTRIVVFYNGGEFSATETRINYLASLGDNSGPLEDDKNLPIWIDSYSELLTKLIKTREKALLDYYNEYETLRKNRSVEGLIC